MGVLDTTRIETALALRPAGPFHLSELYGDEWEKLWIGDKVRAGNEFQRRVAKGEFPLVEDTGRKTKAGRVYNRRAGR
jgi:hypothetical protein